MAISPQEITKLSESSTPEELADRLEELIDYFLAYEYSYPSLTHFHVPSWGNDVVDEVIERFRKVGWSMVERSGCSSDVFKINYYFIHFEP